MEIKEVGGRNQDPEWEEVRRKESHPSLPTSSQLRRPTRGSPSHMLRKVSRAKEKEVVGDSTAMRKDSKERTWCGKWRRVVRRENIEIRGGRGSWSGAHKRLM